MLYEALIYVCKRSLFLWWATEKMAGSVFCDLEKAFDSVNHDLLLSKLPYYGISGKAKLLLESYLQNRYQRVQITNSYLISNTISKWTKIKYGVPQGSILGPLLFSVYINDLSKAIEHKALPILFADDTSTVKPVKLTTFIRWPPADVDHISVEPAKSSVTFPPLYVGYLSMIPTRNGTGVLFIPAYIDHGSTSGQSY